MIPFDFAYYQPATVTEAVELFQALQAEGKEPLYYGGGTEIISFARLNGLKTEAVLDIKEIPECRVLELQDDRLVIGAAVTLTQIQESGLFPLLSQSGGRVADHTIRGRITLGGNLCSRLPYREAVLPLLAADADVVVAGQAGTRTVPINQLFQKILLLEKGELLLQVIVQKKYLAGPFVSTKQTIEGSVGYPQDKIGYPVMSCAALLKDGQVQVAFSGLCTYPFRSVGLEQELRLRNIPLKERVDRALKQLPEPLIDDLEGSSGYRELVFRKTLQEVVQSLEGAGNSMAGSGVAGNSVAGSSMAGSSMAGTSMAGSSMTGNSVAGNSMAGSGVARNSTSRVSRMQETGLLELKVNGRVQTVVVRPADTLLFALRDRLGLTGAKPSCLNGDCGACTVLVDGWPIKACLMLAVEAVGHELTTIEGLSGTWIQQAFIENFAFQCGYCTSGFIMNCSALTSIHPDAADEVIGEWLNSNLCRCTSYEEIKAAIKSGKKY